MQESLALSDYGAGKALANGGWVEPAMRLD
jgi:hypothetical protein